MFDLYLSALFFIALIMQKIVIKAGIKNKVQNLKEFPVCFNIILIFQKYFLPGRNLLKDSLNRIEA